MGIGNHSNCFKLGHFHEKLAIYKALYNMVAAGQKITQVEGKVRQFQKPLVVVTMYKRSINSTWKRLTVQQQEKAETKLKFIEIHI